MRRPALFASLLATSLVALPLAADAQLATGEGASSSAGAAARLASFPDRYAALATNRERLGDAERLRRLIALDWERQMVERPEYATFVASGSMSQVSDAARGVLRIRCHCQTQSRCHDTSSN